MANAIAQVQVAYVSKSCKAVQDADSKAWFHAKSALFEGVLPGAVLLLTVDTDTNKVISASGAAKTAATKRASARTKAAQTPAPAPQAPAQTVQAPTTGTVKANACSYCGGTHHHYAAKEIRFQCASRQFLRDTGTVVDPASPQSVLEWALWLAEAPRTVFAATTQGFEVIAGPIQPPTPPTGTDAPTAATPAADKPAGKGRKAAAKIVKGGRKATAAADKAIAKAAERVVVNPEGTWDGLLVQHAQKTPGLFKFVNASGMPGAKEYGNWIGAVDATLVANIVKAQPNDRVRVTLNSAALVTAFEILSTIAQDAGFVSGIEKSGKQGPAAPRGRKADKVVTAGRTARKAAAVAVKAAVKAADEAKAAAATVTATRTGRVKNTNTPAKAAKAVQSDLDKLSDAQVDAALRTSGRKARSRTTKTVAPQIANCSGKPLHRATCKGNC